jgi:hypothetical protein
MLLLPLLQRALQRAGTQPPSACKLGAQRRGKGLTVTLEFDRPGLCGDAQELGELNQRLTLLAGAESRLHCRGDAATTLFTLELP